MFSSIRSLIKPKTRPKIEAVTSRPLKEYLMGFLIKDANFFRNKSILNYGCGKSNLAADFSQLDIPCFVVDLDISSRAFEESISDRNPVRADGENLPFKDKSFDISLSLASLYQSNLSSQAVILKELMRVTSGTIFIGPIYKDSFNILMSSLKESDFTLIASLPFSHTNLPELITQDSDLLNIQNLYKNTNIFLEPKSDHPTIKTINNKKGCRHVWNYFLYSEKGLGINFLSIPVPKTAILPHILQWSIAQAYAIITTLKSKIYGNTSIQ
jgi:ubiquinone/menaquinone biosynthesis C-methylase UbiE